MKSPRTMRKDRNTAAASFKLSRLCHSLLLQNSPGLHASSAQPAGSDARDWGTQCCTQAALAAALAIAPCMLRSFTEPVVQLSRRRRLRRCMSLTHRRRHVQILPCTRSPCEICPYASAQSRSSISTKIAKSSGDSLLVVSDETHSWHRFFPHQATPSSARQLVSKSDAAFDGSKHFHCLI